MRGAITPGVAGHVLRVVRFEPERGIYIAGEVTLEDFQVHRMMCDQDRVTIFEERFRSDACYTRAVCGSRRLKCCR